MTTAMTITAASYGCMRFVTHTTTAVTITAASYGNAHRDALKNTTHISLFFGKTIHLENPFFELQQPSSCLICRYIQLIQAT